MTFALKPHQEEVLGRLRSGKILFADVGSGKSVTAIAYYDRHHRPKPIVIITTAKKRNKREWDGELLHFGISRKDDLNEDGVIAMVDSWNNIDKYKDMKGMFFIFDEQRVVGKGAWTKSFLNIAKNNAWLMLTATPGDTWMDYIPVFLANGYYKNRTEFTERHVKWKSHVKWPQVEKFLDVETLLKLREHLLVEMPFLKHTIRHDIKVPVEWDMELYRRVVRDRWNPYLDEPIKTSSEMFGLMRRVTNSDPDRLDQVVKVFKEKKKLIIFYSFDYELEILRRLSEILDVEIAEWNGHKHEETPIGDSWVYLVQYTAGAEGWNCVTTDSILFYSLTYSWRSFEQCKGRIDRMNTPYVDLYYYILRSRSSIDLAIWRALKEKKSFNERVFAQKEGFP